MNTLKQFYEILHDKKVNEAMNTDGLTYFQFEISRNILNAFLCYPTLESISFNLEEIERIANVWEGSDEETVFLESSLWNKGQLLPKFSNVNDSLEYKHQIIYPDILQKNKSISFITQEKYHEEINSLFYFLTEEPSFPRKIVREYKKCGWNLDFEFNHNFNDKESSIQLEGSLINFLGPKNNALLMNIFLNNENKTKSSKLKI